MARSEDITLWYFIGFSKDGNVIHVMHDVLASGENGYNKARTFADSWFHFGMSANGNFIEPHRVVATSEYGDVAFDVRKVGEYEEI